MLEFAGPLVSKRGFDPQYASVFDRYAASTRSLLDIVSVATPAEPRGEKKKLFFVQIFGGEKLLKFGEKWAVRNF